MKSIRLIVSCSVFLALSACSSDSKSGTSTEPPSSNSVSITAKAGGKVSAGSAALSIPAGSLPGDVMVTVKSMAPASTLPDNGTLKGLVYEFGPSGTKFNPPATLKLPLPGTPGMNEVAVMSWLDTATNKWVDLDSTVTGSEVSAPVAHFTMFVIRFKGVAAGTVDCSFTPCGGDLSGDWTIAGACVNDHKDAGSSGPFGATCPTAKIDVGLDATGSLSFKADKSFHFALNVSTGAETITVPGECFSGLMIKTCDDLNKVFNSSSKDAGSSKLTCTGDATAGCTCTSNGNVSKPMMQMKDGMYDVSGNNLTASGTDGGTNEPTPYCVSGTTLKLQFKDGTLLTATKK